MRTNHANLWPPILTHPEGDLCRTPQWTTERTDTCQNLFYQGGIDGKAGGCLLVPIFDGAGVHAPVARSGRGAAPRPRVGTAAAGSPGRTALPLRSPLLGSRRQCHRTIDRPEPTLATGASILHLAPFGNAVEAELMSASANGCDFRHGFWGIEADCAGEVCWWLLVQGNGRGERDPRS